VVQYGDSRGWEKWPCYTHTSKLEPKGLFDGLNAGVREREESKMSPRTLP